MNKRNGKNTIRLKTVYTDVEDVIVLKNCIIYKFTNGLCSLTTLKGEPIKCAQNVKSGHVFDSGARRIENEEGHSLYTKNNELLCEKMDWIYAYGDIGYKTEKKIDGKTFHSMFRMDRTPMKNAQDVEWCMMHVDGTYESLTEKGFSVYFGDDTPLEHVQNVEWYKKFSNGMYQVKMGDTYKLYTIEHKEMVGAPNCRIHNIFNGNICLAEADKGYTLCTIQGEALIGAENIMNGTVYEDGRYKTRDKQGEILREQDGTPIKKADEIIYQNGKCIAVNNKKYSMFNSDMGTVNYVQDVNWCTTNKEWDCVEVKGKHYVYNNESGQPLQGAQEIDEFNGYDDESYKTGVKDMHIYYSKDGSVIHSSSEKFKVIVNGEDRYIINSDKELQKIEFVDEMEPVEMILNAIYDENISGEDKILLLEKLTQFERYEEEEQLEA